MLRVSIRAHAKYLPVLLYKYLRWQLKALATACVVTLWDTLSFYAAACEMFMKCGIEMFYTPTYTAWPGKMRI